jgi:hypothetical protein
LCFLHDTIVFGVLSFYLIRERRKTPPHREEFDPGQVDSFFLHQMELFRLRIFLTGDRNQGNYQAAQTGNDSIDGRHVKQIPTQDSLIAWTIQQLQFPEPIRPAWVNLSSNANLGAVHS